jgi:hypothetical protein
MIRSLLLACLLLVSAAVARAQDQALPEQPIMGSAAVVPAIEDDVDDSYSILIVGDALAGGMGAGLARMAEAEPGFAVVNRFNETSGLARTEVYDWAAKLPKIMEGRSFKAAVVLIGANDRQMIRDGNFRYPFNSPEWVNAYKSRVDAVLDVLMAQNIRVLWVSLPPMGKPDYEADMQVILALQRERVEAKGAKFVDIRPAFSNPDGTYTDTGPDDTGTVRKLRSRDGVTFFKQGNNRLGQLLLEVLRETAANPAVAAGSAPKQDLAAVALSGPAVPAFGQSGMNGDALTYQPTGITVADAAPVPDRTGKDALPKPRFMVSVLPGSAAEALYLRGDAGSVPAGRFDDFSFTPPRAP